MKCLAAFDFRLRNKQYFSRSISHEMCRTCLYVKTSVVDLKFKFSAQMGLCFDL